VVQMFLTSRTTFTTQQGLSRIQESGRLAMEFISRDIRMAGYLGCSSRNAIVGYKIVDNTDFQYQFDFDNGDNAIQGYSAAAAATLIGKSDLTGNDAVVIRKASNQTYKLQADTGSTANIVVGGSLAGSCLGDICIDASKRALVISDCAKTVVFRPTALTASGSNVQVGHATGGTAPANEVDDLLGHEFDGGAEVIALNTVTYFVAPSGGAVAPGTLSLWQN